MNFRKYISSSAITACLIIISVEAWFWLSTDPLSGVPYFEPTVDVGTVMAKHEMLSEAGGKVLLVGDSSCMMGLIPETVSGERGGSLNLGTLSSFTLAGVESIVSEAVLAEVPPSVVVIAVLPQTLDISVQQAEEFGLVGPYLAAYGQTSVSYTPSIADWHKLIFRKHQIGRFPEVFGGKYAVFREALRESGGYFKEPGHYDGTDTPRDAVAMTDLSRVSVKAIAELCRQRQVPLVFWLSPVPRDSVTDNYLAATADIARELAEEDAVLVPRSGSPVWDNSMFGSVTHLTRTGAEQNSAELAEYLNRHIVPRLSAARSSSKTKQHTESR
jgi:hypothetical protein